MTNSPRKRASGSSRSSRRAKSASRMLPTPYYRRAETRSPLGCHPFIGESCRRMHTVRSGGVFRDRLSKEPLMSNPFVHVELHTKDLAKANAFYSKLFGWQLQDPP